MKTRVLSVRLPYDTIAYCYALQEKAGRIVKGKTVAAVTSETLEALVEASRKMYEVPTLDEDEAKEFISHYIDTLPGFEAVDVVRAFNEKRMLRPVVEQSRFAQKPAPEEKTSRPKEEPRQTEPDTATVESTHEQAWKGAPSKCTVCLSTGFRPSTSGRGCTFCDGTEGSNPPEPVDVESALNEVIQEELQKDEQALKTAVMSEHLARVTPDEAPAERPRCPWLGVVSLDAAVGVDAPLASDALYMEASQIDDLMELAVRVVYAVIPKEEWSTNKAINMVKKTYKDYKNWRDTYGDEGRSES